MRRTCGKDYILNPATNRCVLKRGRIGQQLLKKKPKATKPKPTTKKPAPKKKKKNSYDYAFMVEPFHIKFNAVNGTLFIKAKIQDQGKVKPEGAHATLLAKEVIRHWKNPIKINDEIYDLNHHLDRVFSADPYRVTKGASPWRVHSMKNAGKHVEITLKGGKEMLAKETLTEVLSMEDVEDGYFLFTIQTDVGQPTNLEIDENGKSIYFIDVVSKEFDQEKRTLTFFVRHGIHHKPRGSDDIVLPRFVSMYERKIPPFLATYFKPRPSPWNLDKVERLGDGIQITLKSREVGGAMETMYPHRFFGNFDEWLHDIGWLARNEG